jgi:chorismate synthase
MTLGWVALAPPILQLKTFWKSIMSSSFGTLLKVTTFGESHSKGVGAVLDGCPPGLTVRKSDIQKQLDRRRPGQSRITTQRDEKDSVTVLSGIENDRTLGTPIAMVIESSDQRPTDYGHLRNAPRPSHADYTYQMKYGIRSASGGGRASARETVGRVAAGAVADKFLKDVYGVDIIAWVSAVGPVFAPEPDMEKITRKQVDASLVRCPDEAASAKMIETVDLVKAAGDSIGGMVTCICRGVPAGWGEPVFDKTEAKLAHAMLSIPAVKGFETGSGFAGAKMTGSAHNDMFIQKENRIGTATNYSGGIQGGITNGEIITFAVAFKPTATIAMGQMSADFDGAPVEIKGKGRHDPCVVPRAIPIVESMAALVLADMALIQKSRM